MSRASRSVTAATAASLCLLAGGLVAINDSSPASPGAAPSTSDPGVATTVPTSSMDSGPTSEPVPTTENSGFIDAAAASLAAEHLLVPYVASQYLVTVTDPACSVPSTGAIGETFACYALKPDDLVIALRATIGEDRLISLVLITNQPAPVESSIPETTTATATTIAPETTIA